MRKVLSVAILLLCCLAPVNRLDVAKLQPVQTVAVYLCGEMVVLETDTGDKGEGTNALEALRDMKARALSVIYLDTAEYLLVGEGAQLQADSLRSCLHKGVSVAIYNGGDVKDETAFWEVHGDLPKLEHWKPGG